MMRFILRPIHVFAIFFQTSIQKIVTATKKIILKNPLLSVIILIGSLARIIGLMPNDIYNSDEAYIRVFAGDTFYRIVTQGDFDPHTYKYGSFIFYLGSFFYFPYMIGVYFIEVIQVILFPVSNFEAIPSFAAYIESIGSFHDSMTVLFMERFGVAAIGILTIYVVYRIACKLFARDVIAYSAAFIFAITPLHVRDSHYLTTDVPFTFFVLLAVYAMIYLFDTGRMKWYAIAGLAIGFSTTVRYFPIAFIAYPVAVLLDTHKTKWWLLKIFNGFLYMIIGVFIGVPFLVFNAQTNIPLFIDEMNKYVLPWYQTSISTFLFSLITYIISFGQSSIPSVSTLIPAHFEYVYISLLLFSGFGFMLSIVSCIGIVIGLVRYPKRSLFLLSIPLSLFLYISFYIVAKYDRLAIPILPFLAIFAGIACEAIMLSLSRFSQTGARIICVFFLLVISYAPFAESIGSSIDCSRDHPFEQSVDWIDAHIPENSTVAFKTHLPFPSKQINAFEIRPDQTFFLEEARLLGAEYAFINKSALIYFMGSINNDFIVSPPELSQNFYVNLALHEYETRAGLLHAIESHEMCSQQQLYYYRLPPELPPVANLIHTYSFDTEEDLEHWHVQQYKSAPHQITASFNASEGNKATGSLAVNWFNSRYVPPRIMSEKIHVNPNEIYTVKGAIKITESVPLFIKEHGIGQRDGFVRIDFYASEDENIMLPGTFTALTQRTYGDPQFRTVSATVRAPIDAQFAIISLQAIGTKPEATYLFDDIELYGEFPSLVSR